MDGAIKSPALCFTAATGLGLTTINPKPKLLLPVSSTPSWHQGWFNFFLPFFKLFISKQCFQLFVSCIQGWLHLFSDCLKIGAFAAASHFFSYLVLLSVIASKSGICFFLFFCIQFKRTIHFCMYSLHPFFNCTAAALCICYNNTSYHQGQEKSKF